MKCTAQCGKNKPSSEFDPKHLQCRECIKENSRFTARLIQRSYRTLRQLHPEEYREIFENEKLQEAKYLAIKKNSTHA